VWDRASLRRFLSHPQREIPGTLMATSVSDPADLENLLDYLESLR
jgi:cytochrome c2